MLAALIVVLASGACGDEVSEVPDDDGREPACMLMVNTEGYWEGDPISQSIYDVFVSGSVSVACMCLNEDEFHSEAIREQLADQLLVECNRLSALFEFDWDECQEDRDSGIWLDFVYWSGEGRQFAHRVPPGLPCR